MKKRQKKKAQATAIVMPLKVYDWMFRLANQLYLDRYNRKQEVKELARNKVEVLSVNNKMKLFIDGTEVKGLKKLDIHRSAENPRAVISMELICDLNTKEQPIAEIAQSVE